MGLRLCRVCGEAPRALLLSGMPVFSLIGNLDTDVASLLIWGGAGENQFSLSWALSTVSQSSMLLVSAPCCFFLLLSECVCSALSCFLTEILLIVLERLLISRKHD